MVNKSSALVGAKGHYIETFPAAIFYSENRLKKFFISILGTKLYICARVVRHNII